MSRKSRLRFRKGVQRGFTLLEIMLVVLIIGILSTFAIPYYQKMTARADRTEMQVVLNNVHVYFVNQYENQGYFGNNPPASFAAFLSAVNPSDTTVPVGQWAAWDPTASGWKDMTFPPEGKINMRYRYNITAYNSITLMSCGNFPGLGAAIYDCGNGTRGNYLHTEIWDGPNETSTSDFPSF